MGEDLDRITKENKIVVRDLIKIYNQGPQEVIALRGIDFEVKEGEFVSLMGASGSGKSTLLKILGTLDRPTGGLVVFDGQNISQLKDDQAVEFRRRKIGFVWQTENLVEGLTALENVLLPMRIAGKSKDTASKRAKMLLDTMGLKASADHRPSQLSGGQIQRVAVCVALANEPDVILGDEICGELDTETSERVMDYVRTANTDLQTTVVNVTHNPRVAKYADRVLHIRDGLIEGQKHTLYGDITEVDAKGRLVVPEEVKKLAGIEKRVVLKVTDEGLLVKPLDENKQNDK
jgi:ABC-type lipoprotein export system ATPase subunit